MATKRTKMDKLLRSMERREERFELAEETRTGTMEKDTNHGVAPKSEPKAPRSDGRQAA